MEFELTDRENERFREIFDQDWIDKYAPQNVVVMERLAGYFFIYNSQVGFLGKATLSSLMDELMVDHKKELLIRCL
jgi:hypothetical protein